MFLVNTPQGRAVIESSTCSAPGAARVPRWLCRTGLPALASALLALAGCSTTYPINPPLAQVNPFSGHAGGMLRLFMTHPPTEERVARLEAMAR